MKKSSKLFASIFFMAWLIGIFQIVSCKKYETTPTVTPTCTDGIQNQGETGVDCGGPCVPCHVNGTSKSINGTAQKGPFVNGTSITVYELDQNFSQTGKSFATQITDNSGSFQLSNISLISNYVQIRADGFYFNEICGSNSISQITLNCITDIEDSSSVHINLLTHLEKPRVEFLLLTGISLDSAKNEAQSEILNIFNISLNGLEKSEHLDISQTGDGNAILLAISSILQGFRSESELSALFAVISNDIRTDGILNDASAKSSLIDHAILLDTISIRNNVSNFYLNLGMSASIPHFEKYIHQFISNSTFPLTNSVLTYPVVGNYGNNILYKNQTIYTGSINASMAGQLKKCSRLTIRLHLISGKGWSYAVGSNNNLSISIFDNNEQFFTVLDPNLPFDLHLDLIEPVTQGGGTYLIEYFEMNSSTPTFSKTISVH